MFMFIVSILQSLWSEAHCTTSSITMNLTLKGTSSGLKELPLVWLYCMSQLSSVTCYSQWGKHTWGAPFGNTINDINFMSFRKLSNSGGSSWYTCLEQNFNW